MKFSRVGVVERCTARSFELGSSCFFVSNIFSNVAQTELTLVTQNAQARRSRVTVPQGLFLFCACSLFALVPCACSLSLLVPFLRLFPKLRLFPLRLYPAVVPWRLFPALVPFRCLFPFCACSLNSACSLCACTLRLYLGACSLRLFPFVTCSFSALVPETALVPSALVPCACTSVLVPCPCSFSLLVPFLRLFPKLRLFPLRLFPFCTCSLILFE